MSTETAYLPASGSLSPARARFRAALARRRLALLFLGVLTYSALAVWLVRVLAGDGLTPADLAFVACALVVLPNVVLGFWHAVIGLALKLLARDPMAAVMPYAAAGDADARIRSSVAVIMTLRNEDPARALHRLAVVKSSLDATGSGDAFTYYVLSDTDRPDIAAAEERQTEELRARLGLGPRLVYRRRAANTGFKAGNVRDFLDRWGAQHEFMLTLDADSLMAGREIVRLVRIAEAHPPIAVVQTLFGGIPAASPFARLLQFGARYSTRPLIRGYSWYYGDCSTYWGHNALIRIRPFVEHGELPLIPGKPPLGGPILSHDLVEAWLMHRAGHEIHVLPNEDGSWEEMPPTLPEYLRREVRWCQGTMQYWWILPMAGLRAISRFQLSTTLALFVGMLAWTLMIALLPVLAWQSAGNPAFPAPQAWLLYAAVMAVFLTPKVAGVVEVAIDARQRARYGGAPRLVLGAIAETVFGFLVLALSTFRVAVFLAGLLFGRSVIWSGQQRDAHAIAWDEAAREFWVPTAFGLAVSVPLFLLSPAAFAAALPFVAGYLLAIPLARFTASPALGRRLAAWRVCAIPEEIETPPEVAAVLRRG